MSRFVPFTVHIRVVPARPGKRFEYIRALQKIAHLVYGALAGMANVEVAAPGGGQQQSFGGTDHGGWGGYVDGTAIKPQFGETPAQLQLTGFYQASGDNNQTYSNEQVFHGSVGGADVGLTGPMGAHNWDATPTATIDSEVKTLKAAMIAAITAALPGNIAFHIFRLDYSGIIYGDRGFTFPQ